MPTTDSETVPVRIDIPPDSHPAVIRGDGPGAELGRGALTAMYDVAGKVGDTAGRVQDKARLAAAAQPIIERGIQQANRAMTAMRQQVEHLDKEIAGVLRAPVEPHLAGQVRAHWAGQGNTKAFKGLHDAIEAGDRETVSAVLNAPSYLSGLSPENHALLRTMAARKFAPDKVARREETADALARVERATEHFTQAMAGRLRQWRDTDNEIIEKGLGNG